MPIPRFNPSDPKLPDQVKPFKITPPKDNYAIFGSSGGMSIAAAAMFTRIPALAFGSFILSLLSLLNAPSISDPNSTAQSPWTGMVMSISAILNVEAQKFVDPMPARGIPTPAQATIVQ